MEDRKTNVGKVIRRKGLAFTAALVSMLAMVALAGAFEAHVINVTAQIENAIKVSVDEITFGTVFPQEQLDKQFDVTLSDSFMSENRVDDVEYVIRQKPKCWNGDEEVPKFGLVTEDVQGHFMCVDQGYTMLPLLCPYLSKHEITTDGTEGENDKGIDAFHGLPGEWNLITATSTQAYGRLAKSAQDTADKWNIDLKVPCFGGMCAQDWASFVHSLNPNADPEVYKYVLRIQKEKTNIAKKLLHYF